MTTKCGEVPICLKLKISDNFCASFMYLDVHVCLQEAYCSIRFRELSYRAIMWHRTDLQCIHLSNIQCDDGTAFHIRNAMLTYLQSVYCVS